MSNPWVDPFEAVFGSGGAWDPSVPTGTLIEMGGFTDLLKVEAQIYGEMYFYSQELHDAIEADPASFVFEFSLTGYGTTTRTGADAILGTGYVQFYLSEWYGSKANQTLTMNSVVTAPQTATFTIASIAGLNNLVNMSSTFKLRFLKDYTLRDDPQEIDLKNTHKEWQLIRKLQNRRIPVQLWNKLTDALCGQDIAGNPLPSLARTSYDEVYGTRTRYGFEDGQILVNTEQGNASFVNSVINTDVTIVINNKEVPAYITALGIDASTTEEEFIEEHFSTVEQKRATMNTIYNDASVQQVNSLFFAVLEDIVENNYELTDLFKTSMFMVNALRFVDQKISAEQSDDIF